MQKIKKGDEIIVTAGKDKGRRGNVLGLLDNDKILVEGVNLKKKHVKPGMGQEGGVVELAAPIDVSNIAIVDPKGKKASRIGFTFDKKGKKVRIAKKSGSEIK